MMRANSDSGETVCRNIGCTAAIDCTQDKKATRCRMHLDQIGRRQSEYRARMRLRKQAHVARGEQLQQDYQQLQRDYDQLQISYQECQQRSKMYDELKIRYDSLYQSYQALRVGGKKMVRL